MHILVVDDDQNILAMVGEYLRGEGHMPLCANDGEHARKVFNVAALDLVVSDIYYPGGGGIEFLKFCKLERPSLPVILMSSAPPISVAEAKRLGAAVLITKPLDLNGLGTLIGEAIKQITEKKPAG